ncbi:hypothetical protein [Bacillus sp. GC_Bacil_1]|uniref:hypothetical protein n=1 Tax=Bacillus sp. GC_Bacil_1 TaxID=2937370 RepID=UPI00226B7D67|nr:hypothetical protein [Bacillus sp. GC_Bacil_1]
MEYILTVINVLFGLLILISGLVYFKNTVRAYKDDIRTKNRIKESNLSIILDIVFICIFILMPTWLTYSKVDFLVDVILPGCIIVGGVKSIQYLFPNKVLNKKYLEYLIFIILGILNGILI